MLTSVAGTDYSYAGNAVIDAPEARARDLIRGGHAVPVEDEMSAPAERAEKAIPKQKREKR